MVSESSNNEYQIFISYRRNGTDAHARVFYEKLKSNGFSVFLDFECLFSGGFESNILRSVDRCEDFVLLLPENGLERCADENDLLRKEIHHALVGNKNIIPIFVNGYNMPRKEELPDDIAALTEKNGIDCSMEYFEAVFEKLLRNLNSKPKDGELYKSINQIQDRVLSIQHDYFKKWICIKLNAFLNENDDFLDGTNLTNPHAEDTFGIDGISHTKKSLKAITCVADYWEDCFTIEYLSCQSELIKKGVEVTRIFVVDSGCVQQAVQQMDYQHKLGIQVFYIEKGTKFIDPKWLSEDYLIQDDALLVQIYCKSHKYESSKKTEEITMISASVKRKIERFSRILERSTRFIPNSFKNEVLE